MYSFHSSSCAANQDQDDSAWNRTTQGVLLSQRGYFFLSRGRNQPVVQQQNNMKNACVFLRPNQCILRRIPSSSTGKFGWHANSHQSQSMCTILDEPELEDFKDLIDSLKNYEKSGVPKGAATDSKQGFDLGRMRRLMKLLGNPQHEFKTIHIAGTKGKGSTAAFSSILRAEGYSVGCYTSPHIWTIRERITLGVHGRPVSSKLLASHFQSSRTVLDQAVELENRRLSHFEVLTAVAFSLFARENVDIAVIEAGLGGARDATNVVSSPFVAASVITTIGEEHMAALGGSLESIAHAKSGIIKERCPVVLGGPFLPHIEQIFRDKASSMSSPVLLASDTGNKSTLKIIDNISDTPRQCCDIVLDIEKDIPLFVELLNVKLSMLGPHQLRNATTATCAALCLRNQGWGLSDDSIRAGLETTYLVGRNQILTQNEAEKLGLPGMSILLDGAHTKESASSLVKTIEMIFPKRRIIAVIAMANDKDHLGFATELLNAEYLDAVFFTEVSIAGDKSRTTSTSLLRKCWMQAASKQQMNDCVVECGTADEVEDFLERKKSAILFAEGSIPVCLRAGYRIISARTKGDQQPHVIVTGSMHIVSAVLGRLTE